MFRCQEFIFNKWEHIWAHFGQTLGHLYNKNKQYKYDILDLVI